jgi:asparagine N-glycosylation enzyme membrane subunit Stt3
MLLKKLNALPYGYWLVAACCLAAVLRIWLPWDEIFATGHTNFSGPDSYYQMNIVRQVFEGTPGSGVPTFYAQILIWLSWLPAWIGTGGNVTFTSIVSIAVFIPVFFSLITVCFVYFIGKLLHSHLTGIIASFAVAVLPGEYFARSWLGSVDYHAIEVLLTTAMIFLLVMSARESINKFVRVVCVLAFWMLYCLYAKVWSGAIGLMPVFLMFFIGISGISLKSIKTRYFRVIIMIAGVGVIGILLYFIANIVNKFPSLILANTGEAQPGYSDFLILLHIFIAPILAIVYWHLKGKMRPAVVFWTLFMVVAAVWQRRFDYYLIIPFSLLLGFSISSLIKYMAGWNDNQPAKSIPVKVRANE